MVVGLRDWHQTCLACSYESASLTPTINDSNHSTDLDETARAVGLLRVRQLNFRQLIQQILKYRPRGSTLLDVGCAHGWFLEVASETLKVEGIEPDQTIGEQTAQRGLPVRLGYFPDALSADDKYDVITFNDVIEHIPDIRAALRAVHEHLNPNGILLLNVPNQGGIFYRLSKVLCRVGVTSFFERLWQTGLPSPHVHYFNQKTLTALLSRSGFKVQTQGRLETIVLSGLYQRISYVGKSHRLLNGFLFLAVAASLPLLKLLPSDILYVIATPDSTAGG